MQADLEVSFVAVAAEGPRAQFKGRSPIRSLSVVLLPGYNRGTMISTILSITLLASAGQRDSARRYGDTEAGAERSDNGRTMTFIWCRSGILAFGPDDLGAGRNATVNRRSNLNPPVPPVRTFVRGFWMGKYEVTQAQWRQLMGTEPWHGLELVNETAHRPAV